MKGKSVTFRPKGVLRVRLERLCDATERPLTYWIEKAIEAELPALEKKYEKEIQALPAVTYEVRPESLQMNDKKKKLNSSKDTSNKRRKEISDAAASDVPEAPPKDRKSP